MASFLICWDALSPNTQNLASDYFNDVSFLWTPYLKVCPNLDPVSPISIQIYTNMHLDTRNKLMKCLSKKQDGCRAVYPMTPVSVNNF